MALSVEHSLRQWGSWHKGGGSIPNPVPGPNLYPNQDGCGEQCFICFAEVPVSVEFQPCGHKSCVGCLERLRTGNIFKADSGVRCPSCWRFVERYVCAIKDAYVMKVVNEANQSAMKAKIARADSSVTSQQSQHSQYPQQTTFSYDNDGGSSGEANVNSNARVNWPCPYCGNINYYWRETCNKCGKPDPKVQFGRGSKPQDLMAASANDIVQFAKEKMHPNLTIALQESGVTYNNGQLEVSVETLRSAFPTQGHRKLVRVVQSLAVANQIQQVAIHFFGNYTIQDLLVCTALLREAASTHPQIEHLKEAVETYSLLHRGLLTEIATTAIHPQGSFVIQKWVDTCSMEELVEGAREIVKQGPSVAADIRGVHIFGKMVQRLREQRFLDGEFMDVILPLMTQVCDRFCQEHEHMIWVAHHFIGGKALVNAIEAAIPRIQGLRLAGQIAAQAGKLITTKAGIKTLCNLVEIREEDQGCPEIFREIPILVCWYLYGHFVDLVLNMVQGGTQLVQLLLERLGEEQELDWIDAILSELVCDSERVIQNMEAVEVLTWGLSMPVLDASTVRAYINNICEIDSQTGQRIGETVRIQRQQIQDTHEQTRSKYVEPSFLQPSLWIQFREEGVTVKAPPTPPPPRPPPPIEKRVSVSTSSAMYVSQPVTPPPSNQQFYSFQKSQQQNHHEECMAKELLGSDLVASLTNIEEGGVGTPPPKPATPPVQTPFVPNMHASIPMVRPPPPPSVYRGNMHTPIYNPGGNSMYLNPTVARGQIGARPPVYPMPQTSMLYQQHAQKQPLYMQYAYQRPQHYQVQQQQYDFSGSNNMKMQHLVSAGSGWQCSVCAYCNYGREAESVACGACGYSRCNSTQVQTQLQYSPPYPLQTPPRVTG